MHHHHIRIRILIPTPGAVEDEWELFSDESSDYTLGAPIGFGASSIVYSAEYRPRDQPKKRVPCALKVVDLDFLPPRSLALLQRETTLMSLSKHPNVLRVRGSWMDGHKLHIALRLMNRGSAADVMRYGWPGGMEEDVCRCILQQALQGLNYLHVNGFIHRDVKAANLLIDDDGTVLLGDLGVAADLTEDTSRNPASSTKKRKIITAEAAVRSHGRSNSSSDWQTEVPCWMAPEVIQARHYDSSADIWSFGITALELTQGRPPRSRESTQRILMKTIQEDPPTLDRDGGTHKYSRAFKELVDSCLVKDPSKRPTAEELLQSPFFKSSKKKSYLVGAILKDLPPLTQRQERRAARVATIHGTIDSWDFATTLNSPLRHPAEEGHINEEPVFEMDGEGRKVKRQSYRFSNTRGGVLEIEPESVPERDSEPEPASEFESESEPEPAKERPSSPSEPPSDSDPEPMSSPASPPPTSHPPGVADLEDLTLLPPPSMPVPVPVKTPSTLSKTLTASPPSVASSPISTSGYISSSVSSSRSKPLAVPASSGDASSSPGSPSAFMPSSVSSSRSTPGLWKKIKGLRRPTSSLGLKGK
ncbi:STE/STE20/FRAY protein kinase [Mycena sanguinolenta]|uniref:STE/STE20/FRAY protein kinase n=1 Tax=Mycena sanguinolenta TaxID=230812 RepID=A0A8H7D9H5_9AGAR|nr:STE/STE20/FRAY protein kinase [Mycena sanguinolenta]